MDILTLAMAKAYSDSKGGYTVPGKVITWDGDTANKDTFDNAGQLLYRVTDTVVDLAKAARIEISGEKYDAPGSIPVEGIGMAIFHPVSNETALVVTVLLDVEADGGSLRKGTYFAEDVRSIETHETIHPIDPKFLPGVCLPVVELSTAETTELYNNGSVELSEEAFKTVKMAYAQRMPLILSAWTEEYNGMTSVGQLLCQIDHNSGYIYSQEYIFPCGDVTIAIPDLHSNDSLTATVVSS